ncbi:hypothetical protein H1S01_19635 [Heliobacterium chlorum]|uniref:Uncharacterized protein n=1 Tax=Heliobacterium chlorum TaxID=2698 RepID=A0ABR7T9R0_HELCL|nr:hypothetical protein [Heliobacterium chlorum]MBC9786656.1 hypothetical protein [Heliobacterium chlorum]
MPISNFREIQANWIIIKNQGYELFGFLLYTDADESIVNYISTGIFDLDILKGEKCQIFIIEAPSNRWIQHAASLQHPWWKLFGSNYANKIEDKTENYISRKLALDIISNNKKCIIITGNGNQINLNQLLEPYNYFNRSEALRIAKHFGLNYNEVPCLIFFYDLYSRDVFKIDLRNIQDLKSFFRNFFDSEEYYELINNTFKNTKIGEAL